MSGRVPQAEPRPFVRGAMLDALRTGTTEDPFDVLVIGGGVSGMEAARVASLMGHHVILIEKENKLGGHLLESIKQEFKTDEADYYNWLIRQLKNSKVKILLGSKANAAFILKKKPDVLIVSVGSQYCLPEIKGSQVALMADEVLQNTSLSGKRVIIVGGGLIGAETALTLALEKRNVTIVEMQDTIIKEHESGTRESLIQLLRKEKVEILTGYTVNEIGTGFIKAKNTQNKEISFDTDSVVLATGLASRDVKEFMGIAADTFLIGDCVKARKIYHCVNEAWNVVFNNLSD